MGDLVCLVATFGEDGRVGRVVGPVVAAGAMSGTAQPVLRWDGGTLRPWTADDVPVLVEAYADAAIRRWHAQTLDAAEALDWVAARAAGWAAETRADWAVVLDGAVAGRAGLRVVDLAEGSAEVAYWVLPSARGRGVAPRAVAVLTDCAFALGLHRLDLRHAAANEASCRVAERSGYPLEGTARSSALHEDGWHDMHVHARLAPG